MDVPMVQRLVTESWEHAVAHSTSIESTYGLPAGSVAVASSLAAAAITLVFCSKLCCGRSVAVKKEKQRKRTVLLAGPPGSGKTVMLHQLMFGKDVETTMSAQANAIHAPMHGSDGPAINLVDFPGAGQLRESLLRAAAGAGAIVVVIDAAGDSGHISSAASLLYDLMTSRSVLEGGGAGAAGDQGGSPPPLCIVLNKSDRQQARSTEQLKRELEADLERLKVSRAAIVTASAVGGGKGGGMQDEEGEEDRLLLGVAGKPFSFTAHAPMPVQWGRACSKGDALALDDVHSFILAQVS